MNFGSALDLYQWHKEGEFQTILDAANEKYNNAQWKEMGAWDAPKLSKQYNYTVKGIDVVTLPSVGAPGAQKPLMSNGGFEAFSDRLPMVVNATELTGGDIMEIMEYQASESVFAEMLMERYFERAEKAIGSFHLQLQSWQYQILSTGKAKVTADMNQGLAFNADFRVPTSHKLTAGTSKKWFNGGADNTSADPIADLQRMCKAADDDGVIYDHFKMSKKLYDKFINHVNVQKRLAIRATRGMNEAYVTSRTEARQILMEGFDIPPIVIVDEKTHVIVDGKPTVGAAAFDENAVVLCQSGILFNVANSLSVYSQDKNPATVKASIDGGHIWSMQEYKSEPQGIKTNYEMWALPIPKNPNGFIILDTAN